MSDIALLDLIRNIDEPKVSNTRTLTPFQGEMTLVTSCGRTVGASTIALNIARELTTHRSSTLLLDCNPWNPYLSRHLGINGINREIARTSFGFSVGEIVSSHSLTSLAPSLDSFEQIVIDYGQLREPSKTVSGRRVPDEIFAWAGHSQSDVVLVSRSDPRSIEDLLKIYSECEQVFPESRKEVLLSLSKVLSRKERTRLTAQLSTELGANPQLISRDYRSIAEMEARGSTLSEVASKSLVLSEIRGLIEVLR
jgi:hypothetical protein